MTATAFKNFTNGSVNPELLDQISIDVSLVEDVLARQVGSDVETVDRVGRMTLMAGGKRLRPAFVTLAARATGHRYDADRASRLGACMEMIHMATLVHDDVIDNAATRRGHPTAAAMFGNTAAILGGDVLLAKAMVLLAEDGDLPVIRTVSGAVVAMAEGEVRELEVRGDFDLDEQVHLDVLRRKTAAFIEACCEIGARLADAAPETRESLRLYGHHVGLAFQIVDDLLDYNGEESKTGKAKATDYREGQATLPLIYLREKLSDSEATIARRHFGNGATDADIRMLAQWMQDRGAFARAEAAARVHVKQALACLEGLPPSNTRDLLASIAGYVIDRHS